MIVDIITSLAIGQDRFSWTQTFAIVFICAGVYLVEVAESRDKSPTRNSGQTDRYCLSLLSE